MITIEYHEVEVNPLGSHDFEVINLRGCDDREFQSKVNEAWWRARMEHEYGIDLTLAFVSAPGDTTARDAYELALKKMINIGWMMGKDFDLRTGTIEQKRSLFS